MMNHPEIRKELLGRSNEWIAERIAAVEQTNAELLYELIVSIERGLTLGYSCEDQLELYKKITGNEYCYELAIRSYEERITRGKNDD